MSIRGTHKGREDHNSSGARFICCTHFLSAIIASSAFKGGDFIRIKKQKAS